MSADPSAGDGPGADAGGTAPGPRYAKVIVEVEPYHLDRRFDYRLPDEPEHPVQVGSRVEVVFAGRRRRGLVVALVDEPATDPAKIRPLRRVFGPHRWLELADIELAEWAAGRFGGSVADVIRHALPDRVVDVERRAAAAGWFPPGNADPPTAPPAPDRAALEVAWSSYGSGAQEMIEASRSGDGAFFWRPLPDEDVGARIAELVRLTLDGGRNALVVVPDPASPTADALVEAAGDLAVDLRPDRGKRATYDAWLRARCGEARVVVGERGVALWPIQDLGLTVLLDEANPALKERRSPRHHAREVVLERARRVDATAVLVGFVPSAEAWRLLAARRVTPVTPIRDIERDRAPRVLVDTQEGAIRTRLGHPAMQALRDAVAADGYGVVLAARRGEGRAIVCSSCGWRPRCPTCDGSLAPAGRGVRCPACGWAGTRPTCADCGATTFVPLAAGTQRIADELRRSSEVPVAVLEGYAPQVPPAPAVLVMTRGSVLDAPPGLVGAVVLPDIDGQLRRPTLDAAEDTLRLSMQLASWTAGSAVTPHPVVVQSREPGHHAIQALVRWDPGGFWRAEAALRRPLRFPPAAHVLGLRTDDPEIQTALHGALPERDELLGPVPDDGSFSFLVKSEDRVATMAALDPVRRAWSKAGVDVRLTVDPVDAP
ncbi:MAG: hypothetical protein R3320_04405 [Nitriliruptorales bacterium]|nr:hypothetical protein [Nitriliruptorales bacterium]